MPMLRETAWTGGAGEDELDLGEKGGLNLICNFRNFRNGSLRQY